MPNEGYVLDEKLCNGNLRLMVFPHSSLAVAGMNAGKERAVDLDFETRAGNYSVTCRLSLHIGPSDLLEISKKLRAAYDEIVKREPHET
jgi:hypothetical protein